MFYKYESLIFRNLTIKETELLSLKEEKFELINLNKILAQHLSKKIAIQSDIWNLSKTEKEIAVLLIKGFSSKEIAAMRNTSEKTVREQASAIYLKAGINNRANLASFFIEDIL
jgi:DNA-binding NarL/FixJ family response regulator